jgi:hypothetical protein
MIAAANFKRFGMSRRRFKADSQFAKASKPSVRPLHYPAMFAQPFAAFNAAPGNAAGYASLPQMGTAAFVVIAFVSMQLRWSLARSTLQACNARDRIQAPLEHHGVMSVRPADKNHQRDASGVYDDVPLGAEFSSVGGVRACFLAPGLGTEEPSILARLQSIWSCSRKRISMAWCNLCQTLLRSNSEVAASKSCRCHSQGIVGLGRHALRGCSWQTLRMLCRRGRHGGLSRTSRLAQRFAPAFDELTQHSKLHGSFIAVRRALLQIVGGDKLIIPLC